MSRKTKTAPEDPTQSGSAAAFYNFAREYHAAADHLFDDHRQLSRPIYFLYFHTVELALKAFLRSHNLPILRTRRETHSLTQLYEECRTLGLKVGADDRIGLANIVTLLESSNKKQGLRYFNLESECRADLSWIQDVVGQLMRVVAAHLKIPQNPTPGPPAKFIMTLSMPQVNPRDSQHHENIRARAYELYEQRARVDGRDVDDWLQAEAEVSQRKMKTAPAA